MTSWRPNGYCRVPEIRKPNHPLRTEVVSIFYICWTNSTTRLLNGKKAPKYLLSLLLLHPSFLKIHSGIPALSWNFIEVNCHKICLVDRSPGCWPKCLWPLFSWLIPTVKILSKWPYDRIDSGCCYFGAFLILMRINGHWVIWILTQLFWFYSIAVFSVQGVPKN